MEEKKIDLKNCEIEMFLVIKNKDGSEQRMSIEPGAGKDIIVKAK